MRITEIRVTVLDDAKLRAFVSVTFDHAFAIHGLKVIKGPHGLFVAMPNRHRRGGGFQDLCHPINTETRLWMEEEIMSKYRAVLEQQSLIG